MLPIMFKTIVDNCDQTICYYFVRCCNIIDGTLVSTREAENQEQVRLPDSFYFCTENYKMIEMIRQMIKYVADIIFPLH